jgi:hypothetical protein
MKFGNFSGVIAKTVHELRMRELEGHLEKLAVLGEGDSRQTSLEVAYEVFKSALAFHQNLLQVVSSEQKEQIKQDDVKWADSRHTELDPQKFVNYWEAVTDRVSKSKERLNPEEQGFLDEILNSVRLALGDALKVSKPVTKLEDGFRPLVFKDPEMAALMDKLRKEGKIL